ncbi:MAG: sensor histidine kinase KdpD [Gammaproteobacteria bacterium]|nr:sensor histidine kinase KdpD [Gammaproteobacteria bacterium]
MIERPNPDDLLERLQQADERAKRGHLKIFFGSSAGVGKTYAMLAAARRMVEQGVDVVVGVVETHGRQETAAQLEGLKVLPLQQVPYRGQSLAEFDLDAALELHPTLILIDELAHSNVAGSRHPKRWQDVEELLDSGVDVYTTLNVQHLESLNDVIGQVTGIRVRETLPDAFFEAADDVVMVDLPPDELLQRLSEGKVYLPQQAARAAKNFFRKGNLIALRELALRRTADRVDAQMRDYRSDEAISPIWQTNERVLVCIGADANAERLIRRAARMAGALRSEWQVLYVETPNLQRLSEATRHDVLARLRLAQSLGATVETVAGTDLAQQIVDYAKRHNISRIILGRSAHKRWWRFNNTLTTELAARAAGIDLVLVGDDDVMPAKTEIKHIPMFSGINFFSKGYLWAIAGCAIVTLMLIGLTQWFDLANVIMLYLLVTVLVSARFGRGEGVFSAVLGVVCFDFFFVSPRMSFSVADTQYLLTFAVMFVVAFVIANLSASLRFQARISTHREQRANRQSMFSQSLSGALTASQISQMTIDQVSQVFQCQVVLFLPDRDDHLAIAADLQGQSLPMSHELDSALDMGTAQWVYDHETEAGLHTNTLPASPLLYRPLRAPMRTRGVLGLLPNDINALFQPEQQRMLDTFAAQIALALERVHFVEIAQEALIRIEGERMRGTLLSALSHDLRTPVTALAGLANTLTRADLSPEQHKELALAIEDQADAIHALVINLLDMAKLQSGGLNLNRQWVPLEEVIGSVLRNMTTRLGKHHVAVSLPPDLPLVHVDELLIARILSNLLENAVRYTPADSHIVISAQLDENGSNGQQMELIVSDDGAGLPVGMEEKIFERFTRGQAESATTGIGLGLTLCREMIHAHGGTIHAESNVPHGARFVVRWPQESAPALPEIESESDFPHQSSLQSESH